MIHFFQHIRYGCIITNKSKIATHKVGSICPLLFKMLYRFFASNNKTAMAQEVLCQLIISRLVNDLLTLLTCLSPTLLRIRRPFLRVNALAVFGVVDAPQFVHVAASVAVSLEVCVGVVALHVHLRAKPNSVCTVAVRVDMLCVPVFYGFLTRPLPPTGGGQRHAERAGVAVRHPCKFGAVAQSVFQHRVGSRSTLSSWKCTASGNPRAAAHGGNRRCAPL